MMTEGVRILVDHKMYERRVFFPSIMFALGETPKTTSVKETNKSTVIKAMR